MSFQAEMILVYSFEHTSIDPLGRLTVTVHCFFHMSFRMSVRTCVPTFQNLVKQKKNSSENNVFYWRDYRSGRVDHWWHLSCMLLLRGSLKNDVTTLHECLNYFRDCNFPLNEFSAGIIYKTQFNIAWAHMEIKTVKVIESFICFFQICKDTSFFMADLKVGSVTNYQGVANLVK